MRYSIPEFEAIYTRCVPQALRLAVSMLHDEDEARDVVQDTFIRLWQSDSEIANTDAFIIRSVRNACLNRISALDMQERFRRQLPLLDANNLNPDAEPAHEELKAAVEQLLTPRERQIVDRIYTDGLSYKDTAEKLGVSVSLVNKCIVTALKKLRNHFKANKP